MTRHCVNLRRRLDCARRELMMLRALALIPLMKGIIIKTLMMMMMKMMIMIMIMKRMSVLMLIIDDVESIGVDPLDER